MIEYSVYMKENKVLKIGSAVFAHGLLSAPMAGVSDSVMRVLCAESGAEGVYTEMVSAAAVYYGDKKTSTLADISDDICPCGIQLFGSEPDKLAYAIQALCMTDKLPFCFDINMGCPVKKIVNNGEGSALMDNIPLAARLVEAAVKVSPVPITVKMRTGRDPGHITAPALARAVYESGASAVCIHGRTRSQLYEPNCVEYDTAALIKTSVDIPVIVNGDITCGEQVISVLEYTGCDGVAVGRAAFGSPYVFSEMLAYLSGQAFTPPTDKERIADAYRQASLMVQKKGNIGLLEARKHICRYLKGIPGGAEARVAINTAATLDEVRRILQELSDSLEE